MNQTFAEQVMDELRQTLAQRARHPEATYRLQFLADRLTFRDAAELIPYLHRLGISHIYASPCVKAHSGSMHGYDIVDHTRLNPELGDAEDYATFVETLHRHGMGQVLDIVPNHMGIFAAENAWWNDVLENGPSSPHAHFFDIDWHPVKAELENKVLLPLLGSQYGEVLESGQLHLEYHQGAFHVRYFERRLPLDPRTYATVLSRRLEELRELVGAEAAELRELESILTALEYLPNHTETAVDRVTERQREKEVIKGRLGRLTAECPAMAAFVERNVRDLNGNTDDPRSFDPLDRLLNAQVYRLAHWKAAADEINYRRFFDINELAAVSTEDPEVFDAVHRFVFQLLVRGDVDGLRVDHIDGLYDPLDYLSRLQWGYLRALRQATCERLRSMHPGATAASGNGAENGLVEEEIDPSRLPGLDGVRSGEMPLPLYVVVEKILGPEEPLPEEWLAAGTTGYDFLNATNRLFVDPAGLVELVRFHQRFTGERADPREVAHASKLLILKLSMSSELQMLAHRLNRISERHRRTRDFTLNTLRIALREILACFPVYRTYIRQGFVSERDRHVVQRAVAQAKRRNPAHSAAVFDFVRDVLLLEQPPRLDEEGHREREFFVGRFQQVTSPLIAKGIEDTAFYVYCPLVSLNEVGGEPAKGALALEEFQRENSERHARRPEALLASTTHDTKRSEDARARINVLSEVPRLWRAAVQRWASLNRRHRREVDGRPAPSRNDEYLFYQTLVGVWPLDLAGREAHRTFMERVLTYMDKAIHEAKSHSSWINPNAEYDAAVRQFVAATLNDDSKNRFLAEFRAFHERVVDFGLYAALSQVLLKLASPGVPDIYQGQELWDFSLVDPDNRRPVDFALRSELLGQLEADVSRGPEARLALARHLAAHPRDPRLKFYVTWQALRFRRARADLFRRGDYVPLMAEGEQAAHVAAFAWHRRAAEQPNEVAVVVAPRWIARLANGLATADSARAAAPVGAAVWKDTTLQLGEISHLPLRNVFTGQVCPCDSGRVWVAAALSDFPVGLLTSAE